MCLAVPARIVEVQDGKGITEVEGVRRPTSLLLLEDVRVGDYVLVHAGFAIQKIDETEARETLDLLRQAVRSENKPD